MSNFWNKLDNELQIIFSNYLEIQEKGKKKVGWIHPSIRETYRLSVKMEYSGNLQSIENLGFKVTHRINDSNARGRLLLEDMERIAANQQVIKLSFGQKGRVHLNTSVKDINGRGTSGVWQFSYANNKFSKYTGSGVVIGIIDTGIDYTHPVFLASENPKKTTRIKRIWDQGVQPHDNVKSPQPQYLDGNDRYGAEYTDTMINNVLQKVAPASSIKHKDCCGHGTHVASIAAGDGRAKKPSEPKSELKYKYTGVAPEAYIVVVKILYLSEEPKAPPEPGEKYGTAIGYDQQFYDAVTYILKVVEKDFGNEPVPVVINYSIGNPHGPHDGFAERERWLTEKFGKAISKGLFVTSAGNDAGDDIYALATIQDNGEVTIPFRLYDNRSVKTAYNRCKKEDDTSELNVDMWYTNIPGSSITPHLTLPGKSELPGLAIGATIQHGKVGNNDQFYYTFIHSTETITRPAVHGKLKMSVMRNNINLSLKPNIRGDFKKDLYTIKITGKKRTKIHIWCDIGYGNAKPYPKTYGIRFDKPKSVKGLDVKTGGKEKHLISIPAGADNILTVAAYWDPWGSITAFSSRGPLVDYSPHDKAHIHKPDIAAPGYDIMAAESSHTEPPGKHASFQSSSPPDYIEYSGTSMSSPHVAGVAALLLQKNGMLTTSQLIDLIKKYVADKKPNEGTLDPNIYGSGRIDAKRAFKKVPTA
jgi:subtilisin family serine protease